MRQNEEKKKYPKCKNSTKVHYSLFGGCLSFVSACTQKWCYDSGLWEAKRTDDVEKVTCYRCKKFLQECDKIYWQENAKELRERDAGNK